MQEISPRDGQLRRRRRRVRSTLQSEAAECGLAALAMVASAHGQQWSLTELRRRFSISSQGTTLRSIIQMADALGFSCRAIRLDLHEIRELDLPAIAHWGLNHFVVLGRVSKSRVLVHDPAIGDRWMTLEEVGRHFTGVALEVAPTIGMKRKATAERLPLSTFTKGAVGLGRSLAMLLGLAVAMQAFAILSPILNQLVVDEAISKGDYDIVTVLAIGMLLLLVATTVTQMLQGLIGAYAGTQLAYQLESGLLRHLLRLPTPWFEKRHIGDVLSRLGSLSFVQDVLVNTVVSVVMASIVLLSTATMMLLYSPRLMAWQIGGVAIAAFVRIGTYPRMRRLSEQELQQSSRVETTLLETIRNSRTFKIFGGESQRHALWQNERASLINNQLETTRLRQFGGAGAALLGGCVLIISWAVGARLVLDGILTLGMLFAFQAYASQFASASGTLIGQAFKLKFMQLHLGRLADLVVAEPEEGIELPVDAGRTLAGNLTLDGVSLRYSDHGPWVIRDVSLTLAPGDFVCLQGPSGGGKTSLLKIMLGLERPQCGDVLIDGVPLRVFGIGTYRNRIGVVLQDDQLLAGTIADNVSFFDQEYSEERLVKACDDAQISAEIRKMPMAFQTLIGDLGSSLSAGQRQRLLLARALYRRPDILFLDEGTANLDPESESRVMDAIAALSITRVVIAHRSGASRGAGRTLNVMDGSIKELKGLA